MRPAETPSAVVCYDGVCGLCNKFLIFLLRRDSHHRLRFAPLQGPVARQLLSAHGIDPSELDTICVIAAWRTQHEHALTRSQAVLHAIGQLGQPWPTVARVASVVPTSMADLVYRLVARSRYRIFGKYDRCPAPPPGWQTSFLDQ